MEKKFFVCACGFLPIVFAEFSSMLTQLFNEAKEMEVENEWWQLQGWEERKRGIEKGQSGEGINEGGRV